ncbi:MAG TPA: pilus assembly protein PilN [Gammaproteobacteria bacterium]|nr:pilus assembly protein PilN [Gammaproteobacteria bacterium]
MTCINLLPWREARRKEQQRQFFTIAGGAAVVMAAVIFYIHIHIGGLIDHQNQRNDFLSSEISRIDKKIAEIKDLKSEKQKLLARMNIIQQLQTRRPEIVHIFDELVKSIPGGIYLTRARQEGGVLTLEGVAQSNARVSSFMRNLDESAWFENPRLEVIEANDKNHVRTSRFVLTVRQSARGPEETAAEAAS